MEIQDVLRLSKEEIAAIQLRCMKDLLYLSTEVLGYDFTEEVHGPACDHFLKPDPSKDIEDWSEIKDRLYLDPREHYKTTVNVAHICQLIVAWPDIRIALFSGEDNLAKQIMNMVKNHFLRNEVFRAIFPEHAIEPKDAGSVFEFTTPARKNWKLREPTLSISTIKSVSTGGHYNVIKYDDVVTPQNSENKEQLAATIDRVRQTHPLLIVGGYRDFIGTRYDFSDLYGWAFDNADETWKIFKREAYSPSVDSSGSPVPPADTSTVLFKINRAGKKAFDYKELLKRYKEMGPRMFGCQYLNNPSWGESSFFSEQALRAACIPMSQIPMMRRDPLSGQWFKNVIVFNTWDLAFSKKKEADYTVGIAGAFDTKGNIYIIDMIRGRFSADEFVMSFFQLLLKWRFYMGKSGIEEAPGAPLIEPALRAHANLLKVGMPIDWLKTKRDTSKNERVFGLLPLLKAGKLFFNKDMPNLDDLIKEFHRFPRYRYDDIPDACSMLLEYQKSVDMPNQIAINQAFPFQIKSNPILETKLLGYGIIG